MFKHFSQLAVALLLLDFGLAFAEPPGAQKDSKSLSDHERIQGRWDFVTLVNGPRDFINFSKDKISFHVHEKDVKGKFVMDDTAQPKRIDLMFEGNVDELSARQGIYDFRSDLLLICLGTTDGVRPTEFKATEKQSFILLHRPAVSKETELKFLASKRPNPPRLIVRGDDMGFSHAGNEALIRCFKDGIETSIEVIVPSPWFPEAVQLLKEHSGVDVGVHLALSSEWDNIKWRPVSNATSLRDGDGYFFPMIHPNKNYPGRSLQENAWKLDDIEKEFRGQIELAKKHIPRVSHLSGHMGCDRISPEVTTLTRRLAKEYGLEIDLRELGVKSVGYIGPHATSEEKFTSFMKVLDSLEDGKTYLFVEHPGLDTPELRAIHHIGYENVAIDRQGVTDMWTNPRIRRHIEARGIRLLGYRDLKPSEK
jgi:uncharacterized protein (TIGR03067 family)